MFKVSPSIHAILNNEAFVWNLCKLNLGFWLILDVQLLPLPRVWLRLPFVGELIVGFTQYEVCADTFIPDYIKLELLACDWSEVVASTQKLWKDIRDPKFLSIIGSPRNTTIENLIEWGLEPQEALSLCEQAGEAPYIMIRGISQRIDSIRY
jgi:hypothetical protein